MPQSAAGCCRVLQGAIECSAALRRLLETVGDQPLLSLLQKLTTGNAEARQHCAQLGTLLHQEGAMSLSVQLVHQVGTHAVNTHAGEHPLCEQHAL